MVNRDDFFSTFYEKLTSRPGVTRVDALPHIAVPLLAFVYHGIELDMQFASVDVASVGDDFPILDDIVLRNTDIASVRSMGGPRVTELVRLLVPK